MGKTFATAVNQSAIAASNPTRIGEPRKEYCVSNRGNADKPGCVSIPKRGSAPCPADSTRWVTKELRPHPACGCAQAPVRWRVGEAWASTTRSNIGGYVYGKRAESKRL